MPTKVAASSREFGMEGLYMLRKEHSTNSPSVEGDIQTKSFDEGTASPRNVLI